MNPPDVMRRMILAVPANNLGQAHAILYTRHAFVRCIVADARTRELFAQWTHESKLDLVITEWRAQLDAAAERLRLATRAVLLDHPASWDLLPMLTRAI